MATIVTRSGKGSPLTNNEVDANFNNLNSGKAELSGATFTGAITANAGVIVDNFTLNGTTLALSSGDFTLDVAGEIELDADGGKWIFKDGGVQIGRIENTSSDFIIKSSVNNKDIKFNGEDGDNNITALTLDMSAAGAATFNSSVSTPTLASPDGTGILTLANTGEAQFNRGIVVNEGSFDSDFRVESNGNANMLFVDGGANHVNIGTASDFGDIFNVNGGGHFSSSVTLSRQTNDTGSTGLLFEKTRNTTVNGNTVVQNGDQLGFVAFRGNDGDQFIDGAYIISFVDGTPGNNDMPTNLQFWTTADGASSPSERMRISQDGKIRLGSSGDHVLVDITNSNAALQLVDNNQSNPPTLRGNGPNFTIENGGVERMRIDTGVVFNETGIDQDFRVESNGNTHALFVDGGTNRVGVGRASPASIFEVHMATNKNIGFSGVQGELGSIPALVAYTDSGSTTDIGLRGTTVRFASTSQERMRIDETGVVVNDGSHDADFRVESNGNANMLFVDGGNNRVGIGTSSPSTKLHVKSTSDNIVATQVSTNSVNALFQSIESASLAQIGTTGSHAFTFFTANQERMRIDSSGNVLVGQSSTNIPGVGNTTAGVSIRGGDGSFFSRALGSGDTNNVVSINRTTADGNILGFQKGGTTIGSIGVSNGNNLRISGSASNHSGLEFGTSAIFPQRDGVNSNNTVDLGEATLRFKDIYLSSATKIFSGTNSPSQNSTLGDLDFGARTDGTVTARVRGIAGDNGNGTDGQLTFYTADNTASQAAQERMRIDTSGNVLVGGTAYEGSTSSNASSAYIASNGFISANVTNDFGMQVNRTGSDGPLFNLRKNGANVGSIGNVAANLVVNSQGGTFKVSTIGTERYGFDVEQFYPAVDGTTNLGIGNLRFDDVFLSGGVHLGGTGAANKLDDYEEGTWNPQQGSGLTVNGTYSSSGHYTKIGRMVYVKAFLTGATNVACSQNGQICTGLPFAPNVSGENVGISMDDGRVASRACSALSSSVVQNSSAIAATANGISFAITYLSN